MVKKKFSTHTTISVEILNKLDINNLDFFALRKICIAMRESVPSF